MKSLLNFKRRYRFLSDWRRETKVIQETRRRDLKNLGLATLAAPGFLVVAGACLACACLSPFAFLFFLLRLLFALPFRILGCAWLAIRYPAQMDQMQALMERTQPTDK